MGDVGGDPHVGEDRAYRGEQDVGFVFGVRRLRMPRYEMVIHASIEVDSLTPEQAAEWVKGCVASSIDQNAQVRGLAVWRPHDGTKATPLPVPHEEQLADFFRGVKWCAEMSEAQFRREVERILSESTASDASVQAALAAGEGEVSR